MAVNQDRMKASLFSLVRAALPRIDYYALRVARVVKQTKDLTTVDLVPDDPRFPSMSGVPLRVTPGSSIELGNKSTVLLGFSEGDPARPFAVILAGGDTPKTITVRADQLLLGGDGAESTVMGETYRVAEQTMNAGPAGLAATFTSMAGACTGPLAPLGAGFTALAAAVTAFEGQAAEFLSTHAKVT